MVWSPTYFWLAGLSGSFQSRQIHERLRSLHRWRTKVWSLQSLCRGHLWSSFDALCSGKIEKWSTTRSPPDLSPFWITHWQMWHKTLWWSHRGFSRIVILSLSCSTLYCLLWDLQHVHAALQLSQRQGGLNTLWLQLEILYQLRRQGQVC